ncbi:hypothetical protein ACFX19_028331 [Malus domestica]
MSFSTVKIESLLGMITVKLHDDNFVKWNYQFQSVLRGYDLFDFYDGESQCPPKFCITDGAGVTKEISTAYKEWVKTDVSLLSLLIATLSDGAIDYVIGCKSSHEAWKCIQERYASVSVVKINQLKTEFHTIQKEADSVDKYLLRLKGIRDQLVAAGEKVIENDLVIAALSGLPSEFETIRTVILARDTSISLIDFRAQLLGAEVSIESRVQSLSQSLSALSVQCHASHSQGQFQSYEKGESSGLKRSQDNTFDDDGRFNGGSGYGSNGGNNFRSNNKRYNGGGNNFRSNPGNRFGSTFPHDNGKGSQVSGPQNYSGGSKQSNSWNGNTNYKSAISPECQICSRRGHTAPNCYYRTDSGHPFGGFVVCQICGKKGHIALECFHRNNFSYQGAPPPASLTAMTAQSSTTANGVPNVHDFASADTWVVDTGATHHMTSNLDVLTNITPYNGDSKITVGSGEALSDKATRRVLYQGKSDDRELFQIPVNAFSRLSAAQLGRSIAFVGKKIKSSIWHKRLGHPSEEILHNMLNVAQLSVVSDSSPSLCTACIHGKLSRFPFPVKQTRSHVVFEKIHSDVWGPAPVKSVEGFRYYISFVDDCSRSVIHDEEVHPFKLLCDTNGSKTIQQQSSSPVIVHINIPSARYQPRSPTSDQSPGSESTHRAVHFSDFSATHSSVASGRNEIIPCPRDSQLLQSGGNNVQASSPSHHSGTTSMLPVHSSNQLEVILPFSPHCNSPQCDTGINTHSMTTRLKSGVLEKKNYAALVTSFPELQSLHITKEDPFTGGYSFISEIADVQEPSSFRKASTIPQW